MGCHTNNVLKEHRSFKAVDGLLRVFTLVKATSIEVTGIAQL